VKKESKEKLPEQIESRSESPFKRFEKLAKQVVNAPKSKEKEKK